MVRPICGMGHPALRTPARRVRHFGTYEREVLRDLVETCLAIEHAAGLSAPQIGVPLRLAVVRATATTCAELVNPEVVEESPETSREEEWCLSIPGARVAIVRPVWVRVVDLAGKRRREFVDVAGRAVQHEIDHLNGVLIVDYAARAAASI